jgi:hypothetical protein
VSKYLIYGLLDPRTHELRYVGKSSNGLKRAHSHARAGTLNNKNNRTRCRNWVKSLVNQGLKPRVEILEECPPERAGAFERFWIASVRATGAELLNHADGGEGAPGVEKTPECREKLRRANLGNRHSLGHKHTKEVRERLSQIHKGTVLPGCVKQKISAALSGRVQKQETIQKRIATFKAVGASMRPLVDSLGNQFASGRSAAEFYQVSPAAICIAVRERRPLRNGVFFSYQEIV